MSKWWREEFVQSFFPKRNIYSYPIFVYERCQLGHTKININKIFRLLTPDWFLVTRFQTLILFFEGPHTLSNTNIQLHMISHDSFAIKMFWNILWYEKFNSIKLLNIFSIYDRVKPLLAQIYAQVLLLSKATTSQLSGGQGIMNAYTGIKPYKTFFTKPQSKVHTIYGYTHHGRQ